MYELRVYAVDKVYVLRFKSIENARKEMLIAEHYYANLGFKFVYDDEAMGGMSIFGTKQVDGYTLNVSMRIKKEEKQTTPDVPWR